MVLGTLYVSISPIPHAVGKKSEASHLPKVRQLRSGGASPQPHVTSPHSPTSLSQAVQTCFKGHSRFHLFANASPFPNTDKSPSRLFSLLFPTIVLLLPLGMASSHVAHRRPVPLHMPPRGAPAFTTAHGTRGLTSCEKGQINFLKSEILTLIRALFKSPRKSE